MQVYRDDLDETMACRLRQFRSVYVYGAGVKGKKAVRCLTAHDIAIDGVVVTGAENNPAVLMGHRVIPVGELQADRSSTVIVIAMSTGYAEEVRPGLEKAGWTCVLYQG